MHQLRAYACALAALALSAGCSITPPAARAARTPQLEDATSLRVSVRRIIPTAPAQMVAASTPGDAAPTQGDGDLASRATDPTASPLTLSLIGTWTTDYYALAAGARPDPDQAHELKFQPVIPFSAWGVDNILRISAPYQTYGPGKDELGDITVFNLSVIPQRWGRLGVGAVASFANGNSSRSRVAAGPAVGFVAEITKKLRAGLFNQNLFNSDVQLSQLQPIVAYQLGDGWSLSAGDLQFVYDWKSSQWVSLPVGLQVGKIVKFGKQPVRFALNPQYNLRDLPGATRFKVSFTAQLLLP